MSAVLAVVLFLTLTGPAAAQVPGSPPHPPGHGPPATPAPMWPRDAPLTLAGLRAGGFVDVALDAGRFEREHVAVVSITNKLGIPVEGDIPACLTVFEPADSRMSALAAAEGGPFVIEPRQTVRLARPFLALDPAKGRPGGAGWKLAAQPLLHDLTRCKRQ